MRLEADFDGIEGILDDFAYASGNLIECQRRDPFHDHEPLTEPKVTSFAASVTELLVRADCVLDIEFEGMYAWCAMSFGNVVCRSIDSLMGEDQCERFLCKTKLLKDNLQWK